MKKMEGKKVIIGVGIFLTILVALLIRSFISYNQTLINQQQQQLLNIVRSVSRTIETYIDNQKNSLDFFTSSEAFGDSLNSYQSQTSQTDLSREIHDYLRMDASARSQFVLAKGDGTIVLSLQNPISSLSFTGDRLDFPLSGITKPTIPGITLAAEHNYLLPIVTPVAQAEADGTPLYAVVFVDFEDIYRRIDSTSIKADEKSYLIVKDQSGYILLHESRNQIGLHAINGRKANYPDVDFTGMNSLIEKELKGKEDTFIFDSYWFSDSKPLEQAKKFSAFTPLNVDYGFWIVSMNMDYNRFIAPFNREIFSMIALAGLILAVIGALIVIFLKSQAAQKDLLIETEYLRELNSTLDELNKTKEKNRHIEKLQTMGIMTGGIAHEFNNILSPVMGYSELLLRDLPGDSVSHEDAEEIYDAACRARDLVRQISELSHKDPSKIVYETFDLCENVRRWIKSVTLMRPENVMIQTEILVDSALCYGNSTQLYEVLLNLCTNAFHAMKVDGGVLKITLSITPADQLPAYLEPLYPEPNYIVLYVSDTGNGMEEKTLLNIFTPFFTTKGRGEGTGLGLSIAQGILEEHQGAIGATSHPGRGTTIAFCVPLQTEVIAPAQTESPTPAHQVPPSMRVLVVDDELSVTKMMTRILHKNGYKADAFQNPLDALNTLRENPEQYGILITDYTMTEMNGVELAVRVRQLAPSMRIIVISGLIKKNILNAHKQEIIDGYLSKPVKPEELLAVLSSVLARP